MIYAFGGYGCNNVGDEAIFEGLLRTTTRAVTQIYVNVPEVPNAVWYADLLSGKEKFSSAATELRIGGGGIAHCLGAVEDYVRMAKIAKEQGLIVTVQGVGLEGCTPEIAPALSELLSLASIITVRSAKSKQIAKELGFVSLQCKDFAYSIPTKESSLIRHGVGVSLSGVADKDLPIYVERIRVLLRHFNVTFIPHTRPYVSYDDNDVVLGHKIWSLLGGWIDKSLKDFHVVDFDANPGYALLRYASVKAVYTGRYHGCIFSEMTNTPVIGIGGGLKLKSFFDERTSDLITYIPGSTPEAQVLEELNAWCEELKCST